jgi:hypothetical protein
VKMQTSSREKRSLVISPTEKLPIVVGYDGDAQAAFKQKVNDLKERGFKFELKVDIEHKFVNGVAFDEFVNACLPQFPYGVGGINDKREKPENASMFQCKHGPC